jgi:hypothetical protein
MTTFLCIEMSQVHRRCRRTPHQAAKHDRRKSLFDPLQSGAALHIDLSRGVVEVREEIPAVLGMIYSGMLLRGHSHWPGLIMLPLAGITWIRTLLGCPPQEEEEVTAVPDPIKLLELEQPHRNRPSSINDLSSKTG